MPAEEKNGNGDKRETIIPPDKQPRPKGKARNRPPVIEGKAAEVGGRETRQEHREAAEAAGRAAGIHADREKPAEKHTASIGSEGKTAAAGAPPPDGRGARFGAIAAAALLGGLIGAGAMFFASWLMPPRLHQELSAQMERQTERLNAMEAEIGRSQRLVQRVATLEQSAEASAKNSERLAAIEERVAAQDVEALAAEVGELRRRLEEVASGEGGALMQVAARVAALEEKIPEVAETVTRQAASARQSSRAAALAALRAAVEAGRPYATELEATKRVAPSELDLAPLPAHRETGVASIEELRNALSAARDSVIQQEVAAAAEESDSFFDRMWTSAKSVVRITRSDERGAGDVLDEMAQRVASGDVAVAIALAEELPEESRAALSLWLQRARARTEAIAALNRLEQAQAQTEPAAEE